MGHFSHYNNNRPSVNTQATVNKKDLLSSKIISNTAIATMNKNAIVHNCQSNQHLKCNLMEHIKIHG